MPKRIFIRDGGLTSSIPTPAGYTVIGSDNGTPKKQIQSTISDIGGNQLPYKYLIANITQLSTDPATINILENTLSGTPTVTGDLGLYGFVQINLPGEFSTANKVWCDIKSSEFDDVFLTIFHSDSDNIRIVCKFIATGMPATNKLYEHSFQIRVYN